MKLICFTKENVVNAFVINAFFSPYVVGFFWCFVLFGWVVGFFWGGSVVFGFCPFFWGEVFFLILSCFSFCPHNVNFRLNT